MDSILKGNYSYRAAASPLLHELIFNVTKSIEIEPNVSLYERWLENDINSDKTVPNLSPHMGSGSDHAAFQQKIGIPCIDQNMVRKKNDPLFIDTELTTYPLYHTGYDKFKLIDEFLDRSFKTTSLITLVISELIRNLATSTILPFNCNDYAKHLRIEFKKLKLIYEKDFPATDLLVLDYAISNFTRAASTFHSRLNSIDTTE